MMKSPSCCLSLLTKRVHPSDRVTPGMTAKETAKLMAWGLGPDWQAANATAPITNVVNGIRRGMYIAPTANQTKVANTLSVHSHHCLLPFYDVSLQTLLPNCFCSYMVPQPLPVDILPTLLCEEAHLKQYTLTQVRRLLCQVVKSSPSLTWLGGG